MNATLKTTQGIKFHYTKQLFCVSSDKPRNSIETDLFAMCSANCNHICRD